MDQSNMIVQEIETHGVRTFSAKEMAFNILGLMHPILFSITQVEPVWGDLSGGFGRITNLADMASCIRVNMNKKAELRRAIAHDNAAEFKIINGAELEKLKHGFSANTISCIGFSHSDPTQMV
jgi:fatty acid synthase subunit alpha, fungi type